MEVRTPSLTVLDFLHLLTVGGALHSLNDFKGVSSVSQSGKGLLITENTMIDKVLDLVSEALLITQKSPSRASLVINLRLVPGIY
jgi:hypothetical protein